MRDPAWRILRFVVGWAGLAGVVGTLGGRGSPNAVAPEAPDEAPDPIAVELKSVPEQGYLVEGTFHVARPLERAWQVLTDYDRLDTFVSAMQESRVLHRQGRTVYVRQTFVSRLGVFRRTFRLHLRVTEVPFTYIYFIALDSHDFEAYMGFWHLTSTPEGVRVQYTLVVQPRFRLPGFVRDSMMVRMTRALLREVRDRILSVDPGPGP